MSIIKTKNADSFRHFSESFYFRMDDVSRKYEYILTFSDTVNIKSFLFKTQPKFLMTPSDFLEDCVYFLA